MGFLISTLKTFFIVLNTLMMFSSAFYIGVGSFLQIAIDVTGFEAISLVLLGCGCAVLILSFVGYCSVTGRRSFLMQLFSICLLLSALFEFGFAIFVVVRTPKTTSNLNNYWDGLSAKNIGIIETRNKCCGFSSPSDRTQCAAKLILSAIACSTVLFQKQKNIIKLITIGLISASMIAFINYFVSHNLASRYFKARVEFKNKQKVAKEQRAKGGKNISDRGAGIEGVEAGKGNNKEGSFKSAKMLSEEKNEENQVRRASISKSFKLIPDFLKPTPKPLITTSSINQPRSTGSLLTYDQIAAKYRSNKQ